MTTPLVQTPVTNTARALVTELAEALGQTPLAAQFEVLLGVLAATIDSQWEDVSSLRNANLGLASERERLLHYIDRVETKNSELTQLLAESDRIVMQLHLHLAEEAAKHEAEQQRERDQRVALACLIGDALGRIAEQYGAAIRLAGGPERLAVRTLTDLPTGLRADTDAAGETRVLEFPPCTGEASWEHGQDHDGLLVGSQA